MTTTAPDTKSFAGTSLSLLAAKGLSTDELMVAVYWEELDLFTYRYQPQFQERRGTAIMSPMFVVKNDGGEIPADPWRYNISKQPCDICWLKYAWTKCYGEHDEPVRFEPERDYL